MPTRNMTARKSTDLSKSIRPFSFLSLPFELRLKIYRLVLPSRNHTIVTQYPQDGFYHSSSKAVSHSIHTIYPARPKSSFALKPLAEQHINFTTYEILNANFRLNYPNQSICPQILRTCKQIQEEAEPILYGSETVFDFGIYVDAIVRFLEDRSAAARGAIRYVRVAREIPEISKAVANSWDGARRFFDSYSGSVIDPLWSKTCAYLMDQCAGLRTVDLTVWSERGDALIPPYTQQLAAGSVIATIGEVNEQEKSLDPIDDIQLWREWEWTRGLLEAASLTQIKVTWWDFIAEEDVEGRFDRWLVLRMVADETIRNRVIHEGRVTEGVTMIPRGSTAQ